MGIVYSDERIIEAFNATKGNFVLACRRLNIPVTKTIYSRLEKSQKLRDALEQSREEILDMADFKLQEAVERGEGWAITFLLKTLGRKRGYGETQDINLNGSIKSEVDLTGLSVEELTSLESIITKASQPKPN